MLAPSKTVLHLKYKLVGIQAQTQEDTKWSNLVIFSIVQNYWILLNSVWSNLQHDICMGKHVMDPVGSLFQNLT
jgi:hypothetical protein